jgi:hypothetical protein
MAAISRPDRHGPALAAARGGAAAHASALPLLVLGVPVLLWPALVNGFPLVFSDTGTYLSQVMEGHLGWDRPPFYSMFLFAAGGDGRPGRQCSCRRSARCC